MSIAIERLPARDSKTRMGVLLIHPGGSPGPGTALFLPEVVPLVEDLTQWYDVVSFDPRGAGLGGQSSPLVCDASKSPDYHRAFRSKSEYDEYANTQRAYAATCRSDAGDLLPNMSSVDIARDTDAIRAALGEEKITYFGNSYGTILAQAYAELYPTRLRAMVLDSVCDHTATFEETALRQARVLEDQLKAWGDRCKDDASCPLHDEDALAAWDRLVAKAEASPIALVSGKVATADDIRTNTWMLVQAGQYRELAALVVALRKGEGDVELPDAIRHNRDDRATWCLDMPVEPADYDGLEAMTKRVRQQSPRIGWFFASQMITTCAGWPAATNPPHPLRAATAMPPTLLVQARGDHFCNYAGAENLQRQIPGSVLLAYAGADHALYLQGKVCVREHVHAFLKDGTLPAPATECPVEAAVK